MYLFRRAWNLFTHPHQRSAFLLLAWTTGLGLAPLWLAALIFGLSERSSKASSLFDQGQLALYAASVLGTVLYRSSIDRGSTRFLFRSPIQLISHLLVLGAFAVYFAVADDVFGESSRSDDLTLLLALSASLYAAALVVMYVTALIDARRDVDLAKEYEQLKAKGAADLQKDVASEGAKLDED